MKWYFEIEHKNPAWLFVFECVFYVHNLRLGGTFMKVKIKVLMSFFTPANRKVSQTVVDINDIDDDLHIAAQRMQMRSKSFTIECPSRSSALN